MKNIILIILNAFLILFIVSCNGKKGELSDYDRMLNIYDEMEQQLGSDTLKLDNALVLQSDIYSARFYAQEQQKKLDRKNAVASLTIIFGTTTVILLIMFAFYVIGQWHKTKQNNRILAQQISEAAKYKEKYEQLTANSKPSTDSQPSTIHSQLTDAELFAYLRDLIEREKLFLDPHFDRQTLINLTGLSKERIGAAFSQGSGYERLTTLIRELRLDHAVRLFNEHPEMSIEQICQSSGFANTVSFNRSFKAKFGMTPTAYKGTLGS